jgi:hypothetical protein
MKLTRSFSSFMLKAGRITIVIENRWWKIWLQKKVTELMFGVEYDARYNMVKVGLGFIYIELFVEDRKQ